MEIITIFENHLYAFKYKNEDKDEFARLLDLWNDPTYLELFFEENKSDLYSGMSVESAIFDTYDAVNNFEKKMIDLSKEDEENQSKGLDRLFKPLYNTQPKIVLLNKSKARVSWLRFYGLRIDKNVYIITGGAIKLTQTMQDRDHTNAELTKLDQCRSFLKEKGIHDLDGLMEEIEL